MTRKISANDLKYRVRCQKRADAADGYGNTVSGEFETQFSVRAAYHHLRGGEDVLAARLENRHPLLVIMRADSYARQITADWRLVDAINGAILAVRDVTHETDRRWITLLCERGVAS